jgi:hypothetical protein
MRPLSDRAYYEIKLLAFNEPFEPVHVAVRFPCFNAFFQVWEYLPAPFGGIGPGFIIKLRVIMVVLVH